MANQFIATGSYDSVMRKLYKVDKSAALASAEILDGYSKHAGNTDTYYIENMSGKYYLHTLESGKAKFEK